MIAVDRGVGRLDQAVDRLGDRVGEVRRERVERRPRASPSVRVGVGVVVVVVAGHVAVVERQLRARARPSPRRTRRGSSSVVGLLLRPGLVAPDLQPRRDAMTAGADLDRRAVRSSCRRPPVRMAGCRRRPPSRSRRPCRCGASARCRASPPSAGPTLVGTAVQPSPRHRDRAAGLGRHHDVVAARDARGAGDERAARSGAAPHVGGLARAAARPLDRAAGAGDAPRRRPAGLLLARRGSSGPR